jgi:hypothetical protein
MMFFAGCQTSTPYNTSNTGNGTNAGSVTSTPTPTSAATGMNNTIAITGQIQSVNVEDHSTVISVAGQPFTINALTDQQVTWLQSQQGKTLTIQVTQSGTDNGYTISANAQLQDTTTAGSTPAVNGKYGK